MAESNNISPFSPEIQFIQLTIFVVAASVTFQIQKKLKQNLRKQVTTPTSTVAPPLPTVATGTITAVAQSSPQYPSFTSSPPHHKDLAPDPLPVGDHMRPQKTTGTHQSSHSGLGNQAHRPRNKKDGPPQKRMSVDAPIPPAKRKNRRRKLSSSNESSTSETPSNASDFVHAVAHQPLEQARPLAAIGEAGSGGGRRGDRVARREEVLHVAGSYPKMEGGTSHVISPVDVLDNTASGGGSGGGRGKRNSSSRYSTCVPMVILRHILPYVCVLSENSFLLPLKGICDSTQGLNLEVLHMAWLTIISVSS